MFKHDVGPLFSCFYVFIKASVDDSFSNKIEKKSKTNTVERSFLLLIIQYFWFLSVKDVSQRIDSLLLSPLKVRRILKGHQGKVLCLNWAQDRRHLVSSSQVCLSST